MDANRKAFEDVAFYYLYSLIKSKDEDPVQTIATNFVDIMHMTEDQINFVKMNVKQNNKLIDNLDSSIELLSSMEESNTLDIESIKIVKNILEIMKADAKIAIDKVLGDYNEDYSNGE